MLPAVISPTQVADIYITRKKQHYIEWAEMYYGGRFIETAKIEAATNQYVTKKTNAPGTIV